MHFPILKSHLNIVLILKNCKYVIVHIQDFPKHYFFKVYKIDDPKNSEEFLKDDFIQNHKINQHCFISVFMGQL